MATLAELEATRELSRKPLDPTRQCRVHWNIPQALWTVSQGGERTVRNGHRRTTALVGVSFDYNPARFREFFTDRIAAGMKPARKVFAWARGHIAEDVAIPAALPATRVRFNPRRSGLRFTTDDGQTVVGCQFLEFRADGSAWARGIVELEGSTL